MQTFLRGGVAHGELQEQPELLRPHLRPLTATHGHSQVTQSTNPPFPTRQWHTQPSPNASPGHIPCSTLKEMSWMAHKTASAGPVEQLWCAIVLGKREPPLNRNPPRESPPAGGAICLLGLLLSLPLIYNTCPTNRRTPCSSGLSSVVSGSSGSPLGKGEACSLRPSSLRR